MEKQDPETDPSMLNAAKTLMAGPLAAPVIITTGLAMMGAGAVLDVADIQLRQGTGSEFGASGATHVLMGLAALIPGFGQAVCAGVFVINAAQLGRQQ